MDAIAQIYDMPIVPPHCNPTLSGEALGDLNTLEKLKEYIFVFIISFIIRYNIFAEQQCQIIASECENDREAAFDTDCLSFYASLLTVYALIGFYKIALDTAQQQKQSGEFTSDSSLSLTNSAVTTAAGIIGFIQLLKGNETVEEEEEPLE